MAQLREGFGRTRSIMLRLTPQEHKLVTKASKGSRSIADYVRGIVVDQALTEVHASRAKRSST